MCHDSRLVPVPQCSLNHTLINPNPQPSLSHTPTHVNPPSFPPGAHASQKLSTLPRVLERRARQFTFLANGCLSVRKLLGRWKICCSLFDQHAISETLNFPWKSLMIHLAFLLFAGAVWGRAEPHPAAPPCSAAPIGAAVQGLVLPRRRELFHHAALACCNSSQWLSQWTHTVQLLRRQSHNTALTQGFPWKLRNIRQVQSVCPVPPSLLLSLSVCLSPSLSLSLTLYLSPCLPFCLSPSLLPAPPEWNKEP